MSPKGRRICKCCGKQFKADVASLEVVHTCPECESLLNEEADEDRAIRTPDSQRGSDATDTD